MNEDNFNNWLNKLKIAWEAKNPQKVADLCAEKLLYYETPFLPPFRTREDVMKEWEKVPGTQKDIKFNYEILSVDKKWGIAHFIAKFTRVPSGEKAEIDGIFKIALDEENLCKEFCQWFNTK